MEELIKWASRYLCSLVALLATGVSISNTLESFTAGDTRKGWMFLAGAATAFAALMIISLCWRLP